MPLEVRRFLASKKLYALNLDSFTVTAREEVLTHNQPVPVPYTSWSYELEAVWFRKRSNGKMAAFSGILWDHNVSHHGKNNHEWTVEEFIANISTGRYGARPDGCWDGTGAWWAKDYSDDLALQQAELPFLQEMLANFPEIPEGYTEWHAFLPN